MGCVKFFAAAAAAAAAADHQISINFVDNQGDPITTALDLRVSLWDAYDPRSNDLDGSGNINTDALHYGGYQDTLTITPDGDGYFVPGTTLGLYQVDTGNLPNFPSDIGTNNFFLQLEYKNHGDPNTSYKTYDFVQDPPFQNIVRWDLFPGITYGTADAGPRTDYNTFTLDSNDNASTAVTLQFGEVLAKTLKYSKTNTRFEFNGSVNIAGALTGLTGLTASGTIDFSAANVGIGTSTPHSALDVANGYYAQFENQNAGAPPASDCDSDSEFGRITSDVTNHRLYICQGASRGWDWTALND